MVRSIAVIAAAIALCAPWMPQKLRQSYARVLRAEARAHHFDPITGVALIDHESDWRSGAVSANGRDYGLAQVRAEYVGACKADADPVNAPSAACRAVKAGLLDGHSNIRRMADSITNWRKTCRRLTGKPALFHRWLAGYVGYGNLKRGRICGQQKSKGRWRDRKKPREVQRIIQCRRRLIRGRACRRTR